jgi:HlyD family secretion protein
MSVSATIPGMVVYLETWKGSTSGRVQTGDSPWPGQGLVNLPDLSAMIVKATVSEVDANKVDSGLAVVVTLDALPDNQFSGVVTRKGTLARKKDDNSKVNVFDVEVAINDHDPAIKPGMSASCRIIMNTQQNVISVPLEAVFEKDGKPVVYLENKKEKEVTVGRKNDMDIEILTGLTGDETVCLVDPTLDEDRLPGDKATEPEMNKGRESKPIGKPATPGQATRQGH